MWFQRPHEIGGLISDRGHPEALLWWF
uniref:Uncharacterized protein n=1 Tax=Anguilla anguilla TaxID=7936 RepID=A0A0E9VS32_ANGAN